MTYHYRIRYRKNGPLKYISHLDFNALFRRTLRRTGMPIELTQGYNPRFKVSFGPALSLGIAGWQEILDFYLKEKLQTGIIMKRINEVAPSGLSITDIEEVEEGSLTLSQALKSSVYLIALKGAAARSESTNKDDMSWILSRIDAFLEKQNIIIQKKTKKGLKNIDLQPFIQKLDFVSQKGDEINLRLMVDIQDGGSLNPRLIMNAFLAEIEEGRIEVKEMIREKLILNTP